MLRRARRYYNVVNKFGGQALWRELLDALHGVAQRHKTSVSAVAMRWVMMAGDGRTVHPIVGLRDASHLEENVSVLSLKLEEEDLEAIDDVLARATGPGGDCYSFERA